MATRGSRTGEAHNMGSSIAECKKDLKLLTLSCHQSPWALLQNPFWDTMRRSVEQHALRTGKHSLAGDPKKGIRCHGGSKATLHTVHGNLEFSNILQTAVTLLASELGSANDHRPNIKPPCPTAIASLIVRKPRHVSPHKS